MAKIILTGVKELDAKLRNLSTAMGNKIVRSALRHGGKHLLAKTKDATPVDTGKLQKGLKLKALKRSRNRSGVMVVTPTREYLGIDPKDKGYYPAAVEYGTENKPANSYLRATKSRETGAVVAIFRKEVAAGVQEAVR